MPGLDEIRFACVGCGAFNPAGVAACAGCGFRFAGPDLAPPPGTDPASNPYSPPGGTRRPRRAAYRPTRAYVVGEVKAVIKWLAVIAVITIVSLVALFAAFRALDFGDL